MLKKILLTIQCFMMIFFIVGCGNISNNSLATLHEKANSTDEVKASADNSSDGDTSNSNSSTSIKSNDGAKKILIAYFSQTGTTEKAAKRIQEITKGDIVQIKTVTPYPVNSQELAEVSKKEKDENTRPKLATIVENMNEYDVIFVGYPIWYHTAPMAVDTFLESYNLSGKKIIPFCTSASSEIKESLDDIRKNSANANVVEGLRVNNIDDIEPWLNKIRISIQ